MDQSTERPHGTAWQVTALDELVWAPLDEHHAVFHRGSGKTHFLNAATAALLTRVLVQPKSVSEAASELAAIEQAASNDEFVAAVGASLRQLEHLGLVERRDG